MDEIKELIGQVSKNSTEVVKIHVTQFKGKVYIDARIFVQDTPTEPGTIVATRKGLCLTPDVVRELLPLLEQAQKRASALMGDYE